MKKFLLILLLPSVMLGATINRYVNTASTPGGNGTTNATTGDNRAYASLNEFEAAENTNLTDAGGDVMMVYCSGVSTDTAAVDFSGWPSNMSTNYLEIIGETTDGVWDTAKYKISGGITTNMDGIKIHNIQITGNNLGVVPMLIRSPCYFYDSLASNADWSLVECYDSAGSVEVRMWNIIAYRVSGNGNDYGFRFNNSNLTAYVENCTARAVSSNGHTGFSRNAGTVTLINCLSQGFGTAGFAGTYTASSDYNLSGDSTAPGLHSQTNKTINFVSTTAGSENLHLASTDTDAIDKGTSSVNNGFTTDIDGVTRTGTWDIGADEYVAAAPPAALVPFLPQVLIWEN